MRTKQVYYPQWLFLCGVVGGGGGEAEECR